MNPLDLGAFRRAPLTRAPFPYLIVPGFIPPAVCRRVNADYPKIDQPGSFPVSEVSYGVAFGELLLALRGPAFRAAVEEKFGIDLTGRPTMVTVRGRCGPKDGNIHTDAKSKLITVLIYMNPHWEAGGGRLRLLQNGDDINAVLAEVPPQEGTLVIFRRTDNSWHGHLPHLGPRRVIQLNWVKSDGVRIWEQTRHRLSAWIKRAAALLLPARRSA
jgi:SM-20-related protein